MAEENTTEGRGAQSKPASSSILVGATLVALLVAGIIIWWFVSQDSSGPTAQEAVETAAEYPDVVATVNGESISGDALKAQVAQAEQNAQAQGVNVDDQAIRAQIEGQALQSLINTALVLQAARENGIEASEGDVDTQLSTLVSEIGGQDAFEASLANAGIDLESVRADLAQQLTIDAYLRQNVDVESLSVSDEDVAAFYAQLSQGNEDAPPLEEVATQLRQQLLAQAEQAKVAEFIETLRADADIQVFI